ncbi:MAG TPA: AAA family ATPase, partial [Candidatus Thermoplasmatota archaeon]|nr:AAA family ATPase [Candidatus Thermoplasmatota archaeon]
MGTTLSSQSLVAAWEQFLTDYYKGRIEEAALNYPDTRSIEVDYNDIDRRDPNLAQYTLDHPRASIQSAEDAAKLIEVPVEPRPFLRIRIRNVPRVNRYMIRKLRAEHLGKFVAIEGLIKKVVEVRPKLRDATFQCQRCGAVFNVVQEEQVLAEPKSCDEGQGGCGRDGPFKLLAEESKFVDSQKIEIQESHEDLRGGAQPERITVYLEEDLTGRLYPGDSIVINGIFRAQQRRQGSLKLAEFIKVVDCNSFEVQKYEFEEIDIRPEDVPEITTISNNENPYLLIRQSFAPELFGMDDVKDALILSLFGGVAKEFKDGTRIRGDIHVLLVGDPGVAKSQSLRYLSKLSPRSIYTSG